jgi:hypothetical protein
MLLDRDLRGEACHIGPERQPEGAIRGEDRGAEDIALAEFPHTRKQLRKPAVGQCHTEDDRFGGCGHDACVRQAQQERGEREGPEAERRGIGYQFRRPRLQARGNRG